MWTEAAFFELSMVAFMMLKIGFFFELRAIVNCLKLANSKIIKSINFLTAVAIPKAF